MEDKINIKKLTESIELAKKTEKKASKRFLWFLLIPIAFGFGWFSFSVASINDISNKKNLIEEDKNELAKLLLERDSLLLVIDAFARKDSITSLTDSTISALINKTLRLDKVSKNISWGIISGADNSLSSAESEIGKLKKLNVNNIEVFYRNGKYRTVVYPLTKEKASIILSKIKEKFNSSAYIVNVDNWCPNKLNKNTHYECVKRSFRLE